MKSWTKSKGLIAATLTAFREDGSVNLDVIPAYIDHLLAIGVKQVFVNGTSAEHASMTLEERKAIAEKWMEAGRKVLTRIVIHCGTANLGESRLLAAHAEKIGADGVSVIAPTYYATSNIDSLVQYCAQVASAAPNTPFMWYHFPNITKANIRCTDFLTAAAEKIPTLIGAKFTALDLYDAAEASHVLDGRFDVPVGADYMVLGALAMGLPSTIGIGYSFLGKPFTRMIAAFDAGNLEDARREQNKCHEFWSASGANDGIHELIASFKWILSKSSGLDFGHPRLPIKPLDDAKIAQLQTKLDAIHFWDWIR